jgi:hypothetical protein
LKIQRPVNGYFADLDDAQRLLNWDCTSSVRIDRNDPRAQSLIDQLDTAVARAPAAQHVTILREFTALFLRGAASCSERQLEIFNSVCA